MSRLPDTTRSSRFHLSTPEGQFLGWVTRGSMVEAEDTVRVMFPRGGVVVELRPEDQ